jgi:hypothetical protein
MIRLARVYLVVGFTAAVGGCSGEDEPAPAGPGGSAAGVQYLYVSEATEYFSRSTLLDVSGDQPVAGLSFPGFVGSVLRVR